jgi:EpsI family protein
MRSQARSLTIGCILIVAAAAAWLLTPAHEVSGPPVVLERMVPREFADWTLAKTDIVQVATQLERTTGPEVERPVYDQVLMRTYRRVSDGAEVMLALAYSRQQRQELKIHRPELCYYGQGYDVSPAGIHPTQLDGVRTIPTQRLLTQNRARIEPVTYWIRIGDRISLDALQTRLLIFQQGLRGRIPDGMLVRASSVVTDESQSESAFELQGAFLSALYSAMSPQAKRVMGGA